MNTVLLSPTIHTLGNVFLAGPPHPSTIEQEEESMLYSSDPKFLRKKGGRLANQVLDFLEKRGYAKLYPTKDFHWVIDTKVVRLMQGHYPSIPGWHCDAVYRDHTNQPVLKAVDSSMWNFLCIVSNKYNSSVTEFQHSPVLVPNVKTKVWKQVSEYVDCAYKSTPKFYAQNGEVIAFNQPTLHRATPAKEREIRFFFRMSMFVREPMNKVRHQVQVYTTDHGGW